MATDAISESNGAIDIVSDAEILDAQKWLASHEGVFVEPASAASIAGLFKCCDRSDAAYSFSDVPEGSTIVCTVTGHGLKDPEAVRFAASDAVAASEDQVLRAIGF